MQFNMHNTRVKTLQCIYNSYTLQWRSETLVPVTKANSATFYIVHTNITNNSNLECIVANIPCTQLLVYKIYQIIHTLSYQQYNRSTSDSATTETTRTAVCVDSS